MKKQLVIIGIVFLSVALFLFATGILSKNAKAEGAAGTWEGTCTDQTYVATFYYDVKLTLTGGSSVSGTIELTCTDYNAASGWGDPSVIGTVQTIDVYGTMSGSELTLQMNIFTITLEISGDTMTGGGQGVDAANTPNTWSFNLQGGGGGDFFEFSDMSSFSFIATFFSFTGGIFVLITSFYKFPTEMGGPGNQFPVQPAPAQQQFQAPNQPPQQMPFNAPPPEAEPLRNPEEARRLPLQGQLGATTGGHLVPWDAPQQFPPTVDPPWYPYQKGTSAAVRCPFCGQITLSPFMTGWFCTNALCPARREKLEKGYTHHQYNQMTWRRL